MKIIKSCENNNPICSSKKFNKNVRFQNQTTTDFKKINFGWPITRNQFGEIANFKITSWNVNGIRALTQKGGFQYICQENSDIFCIQETKCAPDQVPSEFTDLENYHTFWLDSKKKGYCGVGLLTKVKPISVSYGIGSDIFDAEGRCIIAEYKNFILINVYVPTAGRELLRLNHKLGWNKIFYKLMVQMDQNKPVIICGDLNVAREAIDLADPIGNVENAGFTKEERADIEDFLKSGFIDTFRELYPKYEAKYTYWTYLKQARKHNLGWRLDYFLVSNRIFPYICDNIIRNEVFGSDHCPITLYINDSFVNK